MSIDQFLPDCDFREQHELLIAGSPEQVYEVFQRIDFTDSWILKILLFLRGISTSQQLKRMFVTLVEKPPVEYVQCLVARPWTIQGHVLPLEPSEFVLFHEPGYAKIVWGITFTAIEKKCLVQTETRIQCTDHSSRRKFGWYWFFIRPFSGLTRKIILKMLSKQINQETP